MNISAGRHAQAALQTGSQVGDDVAQHVVGHDHVEMPGITHDVGAEGVHVHVLRRDLRILAAYFLEHTLPQSSGVGHGIRLITHEDALARTAVLLLVTFAVFEGVTDHSLYAFAGVDVFLHCDLVRRALLEYAAGVNVDASVFSRTTTKSMSTGSIPFSGHSDASSRRTGRTLAYRSILKRMPSRISLAWIFEATRGSPKAPNRMASKSRSSIAKPSGGTVTPSAR